MGGLSASGQSGVSPPETTLSDVGERTGWKKAELRRNCQTVWQSSINDQRDIEEAGHIERQSKG